MRRVVALALAVLVMPALLWATGQGEAGSTEGPRRQRETLQMLTISSESVEPLQLINELYMAENPEYRVEVTAIPGVAEFNTAMASKIAAGDIPDLMSYQWGTQIWQYANGGHLLDLSDSGLPERLRPIKKDVHTYDGGVYGLPLGQFSWGVFFNPSVAAEYGVDEMPTTFDGWLNAMETMQSNGLEAPLVIPAKDGSGATAFVFGYLHIVVAGENPDWYMGTLFGDNAWNGPEMHQLLTHYGQALEYANTDMLGLDPDGAEKRFAREEAAFYLHGNWVISTLRELNPDLEFTVETYPFSDLIGGKTRTISDYDNAVSIAATTEHPDAAIEFLEQVFSIEGGNIFAQNVIAVSSVLGSDEVFDSSLEPQLPLLDAGAFVGFSEREWIPGIKEIMKRNVQQWMAGASMDQALDSLEREHQRLLEANPDFIDAFMEIRRTSE